MTPTEKAKDLIDRFGLCEYPVMMPSVAKRCALVAVDEIIDSEPMVPIEGVWFELTTDMQEEALEYWKKVKEEIKLL